VNETSLDPRIAALWIVHGRACADLLRAHGCGRHAENYEAAMAEIADILAREVGRARLASAIDRLSECLSPDASAPPPTRH
jgi:hypothetical protein